MRFILSPGTGLQLTNVVEHVEIAALAQALTFAPLTAMWNQRKYSNPRCSMGVPAVYIAGKYLPMDFSD